MIYAVRFLCTLNCAYLWSSWKILALGISIFVDLALNISERIKEFDEVTSSFEILFRGVNIWPYSRFYVLNRILSGRDLKPEVKSNQYLTFLKHFFYGFKNWFGSYKSLSHSNRGLISYIMKFKSFRTKFNASQMFWRNFWTKCN